jgi:RNA polymerase sigma factor (sigma-70 family)
MASVSAVSILQHVQRLARTHEQQSDGQLLGRFAELHEEAAFTTLLRRHGRLVWSVCRNILQHEQDAEDAFQATFLILARRAVGIRKHESVASWLHGVAYRIALKAKTMTAKRKHRERKAPERRLGPPADDLALRELQAMLDKELHRLPDKYRAPFILCCLEGSSRAEAAAELGWKEGTVSSRVAHARRLLQTRLTRRGVTLSAALTVVTFRNEPVCAALVRTTLRSALGIAAGQSVRAVASPAVALLARAGLGTIASAKTKIAMALVIGASVLGGIGYAVDPRPSGEPASQAAEREAASPTPRADPFGDPLPPEALLRLGTTRLRQGDYIQFLQFTQDCKVLIARDRTGVRTWDTTTGECIHHFAETAEGSDRGSACLSPDGTLLATPGVNKIQLWETATAKQLRSIKFETQGRVPFACFSGDGKTLASQSGNSFNQVTLWDPITGRSVKQWVAGSSPITFLVFGANDKILLTADEANSIRAWDAATGKESREIAHFPNPLKALALSRDGKLLAIVGTIRIPAPPGAAIRPGVIMGDSFYPEPVVRIWDVAAAKELRRFVAPLRETNVEWRRGFDSVAFAPDGKTLLAGGGDGGLYVCSVAEAKEPRQVWANSDQISALTAAPNANIAAVGTSAAIHLIDLATGKDILPTTVHPGTVYKTACTPDGRTAVTASGADLYLWDVPTGRLRKRLQGHNGYINGLQIFDHGRKAVTSGYQDGALRVWDLVAEKEVYRIPSTDKANIVDAVSPDGRIIAVAGSPTVLFDARTGKEIQRLKESGNIAYYGMGFTPDSRMLATCYCGENKVCYWDVGTGRKLHEYEFHDGGPGQQIAKAPGAVYFAAVSPDGRLITFASQSRFFEVREFASGNVLYREDSLPDGVCPIIFSPDSRMLAWSGWWKDPTVHVVEVATGKDRRQFAGHTGRVLSLSFSGDGTKLISGSADTTALVWDLTGKQAAKENGAKALSPKELQAAWDDLTSSDAAHAYTSILRLATAPTQVSALIRQHIKPVRTVDEKYLARLIADLDSDRFVVREKATQELESVCEAAVDACLKALAANPSAESRRRLEGLLSKQKQEKGRPGPERLREIRAIEILERARTAETRQYLETLAQGAPVARLTREAKAALVRLSFR